jgi:N-hydroxyarylamine O-acetyltransferase
MMLPAYLERIGLDAPPTCDVAGLTAIQRAHRLAIPFENLDIRLGRGIALDVDALAAKLVVARRGGYCFEQNGLFLAALRALGFGARPLLARVWLGLPAEVPPRTHMLVVVAIDGRDWIADVGFGGSYSPPMPLEDGAMADSPDGARHRLRKTAVPGDPDGEWLLERDGPAGATDGRTAGLEGWQPQYGFSLRDVVENDIEQANHWTSTRPGTRFTTLHVVSRCLPTGFAAMTDDQLVIYRDGKVERSQVGDADNYGEILSGIFGIQLSPSELAALPLFSTENV